MSTPTQRSTPLDPIMGALIADYSIYPSEGRNAATEPAAACPSLSNDRVSVEGAEGVAVINVLPASYAGDTDIETQQLLSDPVPDPDEGEDKLGSDLSQEGPERKEEGTVAEESLVKALNWRRGLILITLCFARVCSASLASLLAPFFPNEAFRKGASSEEVGLIFGGFQLVVFVFSPIYGRNLVQIGGKFMFVAGNVVLSFCGALFGALYWCPNNYFVMMCFFVRFLEAVAAGAQGTANQAIATHTFPKHVSTVMGWLQAAGCAGLTLGPVVGGALYAVSHNCHYGFLSFLLQGLLEASFCLGLAFGPVVGGLLYAVDGYYLPFAVMGGVSLLNGCAAFFLLPSSNSMEREDDNDESVGGRDIPASSNIQEGNNTGEGCNRHLSGQHVSKMTMLKFTFIPMVFLTGLLTFMGQAAIGYTDVALSPHLVQDVGVQSMVTIGVIFLIPSGIVIILAPVYGIIADKFKRTGRLMMIGGSLLSGASFLALGPCPVLPIQQYKDSKLLVIVSLVAGGFAWASLVVAFQEFVIAARKMGLPDTLATKGMLSGIFSAFNSLGAFLGPTVAGPLLTSLGFPWATTVIAGSIVLPGFLLLLYTIGECCCSWSMTRTDM